MWKYTKQKTFAMIHYNYGGQKCRRHVETKWFRHKFDRLNIGVHHVIPGTCTEYVFQ
jgi:hypothetical protein